MVLIYSNESDPLLPTHAALCVSDHSNLERFEKYIILFQNHTHNFIIFIYMRSLKKHKG